MAGQKQPSKSKKNTSTKKQTMEELREKHPFETDSQIKNRYGDGREKPGSDGTNQDARGSNH
jgi:hypothetical protein